MIKGADKCSVVVVRDRQDYIKETEKQLGDEEIGVASLLKTLKAVIGKKKKRADLKKG